MRFPIDPRAPKREFGADLPITPELLAAVLCLPIGTRIHDARYDDATRTVVLTITHPDVTARRVVPQYRQEWDTARVHFVGWGQEGDSEQVEFVNVRMS